MKKKMKKNEKKTGYLPLMSYDASGSWNDQIKWKYIRNAVLFYHNRVNK